MSCFELGIDPILVDGMDHNSLELRSTRQSLVRSAIRFSALSVAWSVIAGGASVAFGVATGSLALMGFGLDSVIDGSASAVLIWRFADEQRQANRAARVEHVAGRVVGTTMLCAAAYIAVQAVRSLLGHSLRHHSIIATTVAAASVVVLPFLAYFKLSLARQLQSGALRGDGVLSAAGAVLASVALLGLRLDDAFGWWWADPAAALVIASALAREGRRTFSV